MHNHFLLPITSLWLYGLILCFASGCTEEAPTSQEPDGQGAAPVEDISAPETSQEMDAVEWETQDPDVAEPRSDSTLPTDGGPLPDAPQPPAA